MRRLALLVAAAVAVAATAVAAPASAAVAERCDQLRGKTKIKTAKIRVVEIRARDGRLKGKRAYGCVRPRGKVHKIAEDGVPLRGRLAGNVNQIDYRLGRSAGRFLEVERSEGDGIALEQSEQKAVMDLRTGRNRRFYKGGFAESRCGGQDAQSFSRSTPPVDRVVLSASGAFAVLYADRFDAPEGCFPFDGQALLRGFPPSGSPVRLDLAPEADIPPGSVTVAGTTVTWTNAGRQREADL